VIRSAGQPRHNMDTKKQNKLDRFACGSTIEWPLRLNRIPHSSGGRRLCDVRSDSGPPDDNEETRSLPGQSIRSEPVEGRFGEAEVLRQERLGVWPIKSVRLNNDNYLPFFNRPARILPPISGRFIRSRSLRTDSAKTYENPARGTACRNTDEFPGPSRRHLSVDFCRSRKNG
jgi:hypothetical protein